MKSSQSRTSKKATLGFARPVDTVHIPLPFDEAVRGLLKLKPTKDMPRPGATKKKAGPDRGRGKKE